MHEERRFISEILIAASLLMTIGCDLTGDGGSDSGKIYSIGDTGPSGVGIVFYVTDGGLHGLEVAPEDQGTNVVWSNNNVDLVNGSSALPDEIGTGSANTDAIINQPGNDDCAALRCRNYRAAEEGDWFLPSRNELKAIWDNLVDDGSGSTTESTNNGVGNFATTWSYWSSSESSVDKAWLQSFYNGNDGVDSKTTETFVRFRAVRAF